jgi:hypothetical protein
VNHSSLITDRSITDRESLILESPILESVNDAPIRGFNDATISGSGLVISEERFQMTGTPR